MNHLTKKLVAWVSVVAMVSTMGVTSVYAEEATTSTATVNYFDRALTADGIHGDTNIEDMEYVHYEMSDIESTIDAIEKLADATYDSKNVQQFFNLDNDINVFAVKLINSFNLASLYYYQSPSIENSKEYSSTYSLYTKFMNRCIEAYHNVMVGSFGSSLLDELQSLSSVNSSYASAYEYYASFLDSDSASEEVQNINSQISDKLTEYYAIVQTDISDETVEYNGTTMSYAQLDNEYVTMYYSLVSSYDDYDEIPQETLDEYYALEGAVESAKKAYGVDNDTLGQLYIDVVNLYDQLAKAQGYDDYLDMAYVYDFEEVSQISSDVKQYLTPLMEEYTQKLEDNPNYTSAVSTLYSIEDAEALAPVVVSAVGNDYMEIYEYMVDHNLLVLDDDYTFQQGYTTALPEYSESYIYMTFYGSNFYSWFTNGISHEFGHFIDWYYNLDDFASKGNNFAESVSVSFSYICNDELDAYFDDPTKSNLLCVSNVIDNTLNYVNSCLSINDLEVYAFQNRDTITPSDLEDTYIQLTYDYGMCSSVAYQLGCLREDNSYVTTNQVYVQPFYTIDYAMAGLSALSILDAYAEDNEAGLALFDTLYDNDYYDYITLMKDGLGIDLYADGYVYNITQNLDAYLKGKLADAVDGYDSGDVNLDGNVDVTDLLALKKYLLGMEVSNFNSTTADVNGDGTINVLDLLTLKKVLLGMDE